MSKGIKVSKKHGLNPTIPICFWCGKDKNEIALLGKLKGDAEAPRRFLMDYEPCDECKKESEKAISNGFVLLIEASKEPYNPNQPEIQKGVYPSGRSLYIKKSALNDIFTTEVKGDTAFVEADVYKAILDMLDSARKEK